MKQERVIILGASNKPERYAHRAQTMLTKHGHSVVLINPGLKEIDGLPVMASLSEVTGEVDTVTVYVNQVISGAAAEQLLALKPKRVIFNPGTENEELAAKLTAAGISAVQACTLVLLTTNQF